MDAISLATTLADILRLPEECLGISFVYLNRFELRVSTPFDFISGYMIGAMCDFGVGDSSLDAADELDARSKEYKEGNRIIDVMETGIAKDCKTKAMAACKDYQLSNYFPARSLAAACVYTALRDRGLLPGVNAKTWLREKISRTIDMEDFEEAVSALDKI
ncbi:cyclin-l2 isoform 1 [Neofusicoccum parvum]|nr:cyclin-l2 isoform 1 [Neofusicoccum parvum]